VELTYSEEVIGALNPVNYSITPDLTIIDVVDVGNNTYRLVTGTQVPWDVYSITVSNITDLSGNPINNGHNSAKFVGGMNGAVTLMACLQGIVPASAGDVNGDGFADVIVGGGKASIYFGGPTIDNTADVVMGVATDVVSSAGDVNGDGYSDVIVGAKYVRNEDGDMVGNAYIYFGGPAMDNLPDVTMEGEGHGDYFGCSVASAGDVNNDGYSDVIVGAEKAIDEDGIHSGKTYIYFGGPSMDNLPDVIMDEGKEKYDYFGCSVASAGDVNDDGYSDVIVGAKGEGYGMVYVYFGGSSMDNLPDVIMVGQSWANDFGCSVSSAGDVNGDGYSDVIVGIEEYDINEGNAYIYFGGLTMDNLPDVIMEREGRWDDFAYSVASAGDINSDGYSDVIVGAQKARNEDGVRVGKTYIYFGGLSMDNLPDVTMTGKENYRYYGSTVISTGDLFGCWVASAGDVNGDGASEVIIGASKIGMAYLYSLGLALPRLNPEVSEVLPYGIEVSYTQNVVGADKPENYTISPDLGKIIVFEQENNTYFLFTPLPQTPGELYTIRVNGVTNTAGMSIAKDHCQASFYGYNDDQDNTPPSVPIVTDDGRKTSSRTTLYAHWSSEDAESEIIEYQYAIGSTFNENELIRDVLDWTSIGTVTEITCVDLDLFYNTTYYFVVRAKNEAGLWSKPGMSDGITVEQAFVQTTNIIFPKDNISCVGETISISAEVADSGAGPLEYQFLIDGGIKRSWNSSPNFAWAPGFNEVGLHTVEIQVRNSDGQISTVEKEIYIFRKAMAPPSP
jgi:hypothetical protein